MKDSLIKMGGGRELAYTDIGDPDGPCVLFCHGAPLSRLYLTGMEDEFAAQGLRVVSPDRPGYGKSSPQLGRSMADWPADVAVLADALEIDRFLVAGHSSGGPYAVACADLLRERVLGGVVLAGVTDMAWPSAWDGYLEVEIQIMRLPGEREAVDWCDEHIGADGSGFLAGAGDLPEPDAALLTDKAFEQEFMAAFAEAFRQGVTGYAQDVYVQGRPWPFDPGRISAPMEILHGELDTFLPVAHSRHTAELIPRSTFRMLPGHGHLTIVAELPKVASSLVR